MSEIWPLAPNWTSPLKETYEYLTEVFTSRDGTEQRRALRSTPRRTIGYDSIATGGDLSRMEGVLARKQHELLYGADFVRGVKTSSAMPIGANSVTVRSVPDWLVVGAVVAISHRRKVRDFTVAGVSGNTVTFEESTAVSFASGSRVSRTVLGYVRTSMGANRVTDSVATVSTEFQPDPGTETVDEGSVDYNNWHDGREIFPFRPNWARSPSVTYSHDVETVDYNRGRVQRFSPIDFPTTVEQASYLGRSTADTDKIVQFFARRKGRRGEFWFRGIGPDIQLATNIPANSIYIAFAGEEYFEHYANDTVHSTIEVTIRNGMRFRYHIATMHRGDGYTVVVTDTPQPFTVLTGDVVSVKWLTLRRFATDTLAVEWVSDGVAQTQISTMSLEYRPSEDAPPDGLDELTLYMLSTFGADFTEDVLCDPLEWAVNVRYPEIAGIP